MRIKVGPLVKTTGDKLPPGVLVAVGTMGVAVGGTSVWVGVKTGMAVLVAVGAFVGAIVAVATGVDDPLMLTSSLGEFVPDSREARLIAVVPGVVTPKLNVPSLLT